MGVMVGDLGECYTKHGDALVRFAATQVGASDADDVVSAAVLGVLQRGVNDMHDTRASLYRAVAHASIKHWRGLGRRRRRDVVLVPAEPWRDPDGHDPRSERLIDALRLLSVQQRAIVHLTYWEDLTPAIVAERLGVSDGTVRRQLARARDRLRTVLDGQR